MTRISIWYCAFFIGFLGDASAVIIGWGDNNVGQVTIPAGLSNTLAIATGPSHSLAVKSDGTVVGWGSNSSGETTIPEGLSNVVAVAAGGDGGEYYFPNSGAFSLALKSDGTVFGWGQSQYGQATGSVSSSVTNGTVQLGGQVVSDVVAIAADRYDSLALKGDGTVVEWGLANPFGQMPPVGLSNVVKITAGYFGFLALKGDGTVVGWGDSGGQILVPAGLSNVVSIAAGYDHSLALKSDGTVVGWGQNNVGQISVPAGLSNVVAIVAGGGIGGTFESDSFSLALKADGTVVQWGAMHDAVDLLGNIFVPPPSGLSGVTNIVAGGGHCLATGSLLVYAPRIFNPVQDASVNVGGTATFSVGVDGTAPIRYQWFFNGAPIAGATNSSYTLMNAQLTAAGNYSVFASNPIGHVTSFTAKLRVNPVNDLFANRHSIAGGGGRILGSSVGATKELSEPNHAGNDGGSSVWYSWQSPVSGVVTIDTIGSNFDTLLAVYTGTNVASLTLVAADDDGANFNSNSKLSFTVTAGGTYAIAVDGYAHHIPYYYVETGGLVLNVTPALNLNGMARAVGGEFRFTVAGPGQTKVIIQTSSDLKTWVPLSTNSIPETGVILFSDFPNTGQANRFYRALLH